MNDKLKKIIIPFVLMLVFNLGIYYLKGGQNFGGGLSVHVGILLVSGMILGPYGALGATVANFLCDIIRGYGPVTAAGSFFFGFAISYLGYKLWYGSYSFRPNATRLRLSNTRNVVLFLSIVLFCGLLYSILHGKLFYLTLPETISLNSTIEIRYFLNFINSSFIFGIIGIWISNKIDFAHIPQSSKDKPNKKFYQIVGALLVLSILATLIIDSSVQLNNYIVLIELAVLTFLLFVYLKKPITSDMIVNDSKSIPEEIMNLFQLSLLSVIFLGIIISYDHNIITAISNLLPLNVNEVIISMMLLMDILLLIFFIPSLAVLRYVEIKVIEPILSFARIEDFIHENEKIESDGLVEIYSRYISDETEIGTLARSYTDLINFNNNYIENIREIEGEKERIKAELNIAYRIQAANLPKEGIFNEYYSVNGYSQPAREVGGDFFDYYELDDDHLAIVIGDASGKGVPAAILAMISQVMIKQMLKNTRDPSEILYLLNNQLCENNSESMFITLWIGIYNKTTKQLTFSNAGHNPPLIKENDEFKYLNIDAGLVLGIMEDFDFVREEITLREQIVLFTDGITDASNTKNEMYGEDKLLNFFNEFKSDKGPIMPLLSDIHEFTRDAEQFDDMTVLYLKIKD